MRVLTVLFICVLSFSQTLEAQTDLGIKLYPRAELWEEATRMIAGEKDSNWMAFGVYRTKDSIEEVLKYFKEQAKRAKPAKDSPPAARKLMLEGNWRTIRTGFNSKSFFGIGSLLSNNTDSIEWGQSGYGVIPLADSVLRIVLISPPAPKNDGTAAGTLILIVREHWPSAENSVAGDEEEIYNSQQITWHARIISRPDAEMTQESRIRGVTGKVVLRAVFRASGKVTDIRVVKGLPAGLTEQAIKAAARIKFEPAMKGGRYVSQTMQLEYSFNIYY